MKRLLLGVGNRLSHDDGAGPAVAEALAESCWQGTDCGTSLENAGGLVRRVAPDVLVLVDAARMGLAPGEVRRLPTAAPDRMLASTHGLPLPFVLSQIAASAEDVVLIGIEPDDLSWGEGLSAVVSGAVASLVRTLEEDRWMEIPLLEVRSAR